MKTYIELTEAEQANAHGQATHQLLESILEGSIRFNDGMNGDNLQACIDAACAKAERMQTPWFAGEYIMDSCGDDIKAMSLCDAEDSLYAEPSEHVIHGIIR